MTLTALYAAALLGAWWLMTRVGEQWWPANAMLYAPRPLFGLPLVPLALLGALVERRLLLVHGLCLLFVLGPVMGWRWPRRGEAPAAGTRAVRILTYNVGGGADSVAALLRTVADTAPDVVVAQEARDLASLFPGWTTHQEGELFLATRLRLLDAQGQALEPDAPWRSAMRYRLEGPKGPFTLFSLHLYTPRRALEELRGAGQRPHRWGHLASAGRSLEANAARRARQSFTARAFVEGSSGPRVIAGDFNLPADSPLYRFVWGHYRDTFDAAGRGYGYTFPAPRPWMRIDHILATQEWRVARAWTAPGSGRDHLPMIADLWLP